MSKLILVSNDDGVLSKGIRTLARFLKNIPNARVVVVAPDREKSAASHSLTLHRPIRYERIAKDVYSVEGTPTDCVVVAVHEILKRKPDVVVSGINRGGNLGEDVHYSGTVSAAMEGVIAGVPGVAISLVTANGRKPIYTAGAKFAVKLVKQVLNQGLPYGVVLNVNVPNVLERELKGVEIVKLGKRNYGSLIVEKLDPKKRKYYWITGDDSGFENIPHSDCNAILAKKISITPIYVDMTHHEMIETMKQWKL